MNKGFPGLGQPNNELLGPGAIYAHYGETNEFRLALTKGGSEFTDNAEYRQRGGDGDYGPIKGAIDLVAMTPQLKIRSLRIDAQAFAMYYAGVQAQAAAAGVQKLYRTDDLSDSYTDNIAFVGQTRGGDNVVIVLDNAIGMNALAMAFVKNEETVPEVTFTATFDPATFDPDDNTTWPYHIEFEAGAVMFTAMDDTGTPAAVAGALVALSDGQTALTDESGVATFTCTFGKVGYSVTKAGYTASAGTITVDAATEDVSVTLATV